MADNKYDNYIISGPLLGNPLGSGTTIAWVHNDLFKGSHQYHVHWVHEYPRNVPGMKSWEDMGHGPHEHKTPEKVEVLFLKTK